MGTNRPATTAAVAGTRGSGSGSSNTIAGKGRSERKNKGKSQAKSEGKSEGIS